MVLRSRKASKIKLREAADIVVGYLWDTEMKDYCANDHTMNHVFLYLRVLNREFRLKNEEKECEAMDCPIGELELEYRTPMKVKKC